MGIRVGFEFGRRANCSNTDAPCRFTVPVEWAEADLSDVERVTRVLKLRCETCAEEVDRG